MRTVIVLPDLHVPLHNRKALKAVEAFMAEAKPSDIIYLGDFMDLGVISHWNTDRRRFLETKRLLSDYNFGNEILDKHQALCPEANFVYFKGNHEAWVDDLVDKQPQYEGIVEVEVNLKLKERGFVVVPFNRTFRIGKLLFLHGHYQNRYHSQKTVSSYGKSIIYGHCHDFQSFTHVSPVDARDFHIAWCIGTLGDLNPDYLKNKPNNWVTGFAVCYIDEATGKFNVYPIVITGGKFIYAGRQYGD